MEGRPKRIPPYRAGSFTFTTASAATFRNSCTIPEGQRISTRSATFAAPSPKWVGPALAPQLLEVWRLNELVAREKPVPPGGHAFPHQPLANHMPIVPDEALLGERDLDYFMTPLIRDQSKMKSQQGGIWRTVNYEHDDKIAYLRQYETVVFPSYAKALGILNELLARKDLTAEQRTCLQVQKDSFAGDPAMFRRQCNWIQASFYRLSDETVPPGTPPYRDIIRAEIAVTSEMLRAQGRNPDDDPRIRLMKAHMDDPLRRVDLTQFPKNRHAGTKGWTGAHELPED